MNRGKRLLALGLVLLVLCAGTFAASRLTLDRQSQEDTETATAVFGLDPETVTSVRWEYSEELTFDRTDDGWIYRDSDAFPVDSTYLDTILDTLSQVDSYKTIENIENWDAYGLEIPVCTISVAADETYDLAIGIETTLGGQRYFSIGDGKVYLVDSGILDPFRYGLYDLMEVQEMPQVSQVSAMEVTTPEGSYTLTYEPDSGRTYSDEYVWFWGDTPLDTKEAVSLVGVVTQMTLAQCEDYDCRDLSLYGLDDPELTVTIYDAGAKAYTLSISEAKNGTCYIRLPGTNMVYAIDEAIGQTLRYTTAADLEPEDVLLMDWDTVNTVALTLDDQEYLFTRTQKQVTDEAGETTAETVWLLDKEAVDVAQVLADLTALSSTGKATGLTPQAQAQLELTITRERDTFSEITLAIYPYSSENCLVTLDGTATVTVSRQAVAELVAAMREVVEK